MTSRITTPLFLYWFAAVLPPRSRLHRNNNNNNNNGDVDYYDILGLSPKCSIDEIKKAFKKKSLRLHPDKVAQRGGDPIASQQEYELVQQAHEVLSNPKKRRKYHQYGQSSTLYQFMEEDNWYNPSNLTNHLSQASCLPKTRLFLMGAILLLILLSVPVLMCIKVNHTIEGGALESTDWILVLIPLWILQSCYIIGVAAAFVMTQFYWMIALQFLEATITLAAEILLVLEWDDTITWSYWQVFVPIYVLFALRLGRRCATLVKVRRDIQRMVTLEFVEQELGRSYEDLTEEQREMLARDFLIVQIPPDLVIDHSEDGDEVQYSPEYEAAMDVYHVNLTAIRNLICFAVPQIVLIILQLEEIVDVSWWLIFVPSWVYISVSMMLDFYQCCCGSGIGSEIIMSHEMNPNNIGDGVGSDDGVGGLEDTNNTDSPDPGDAPPIIFVPLISDANGRLPPPPPEKDTTTSSSSGKRKAALTTTTTKLAKPTPPTVAEKPAPILKPAPAVTEASQKVTLGESAPIRTPSTEEPTTTTVTSTAGIIPTKSKPKASQSESTAPSEIERTSDAGANEKSALEERVVLPSAPEFSPQSTDVPEPSSKQYKLERDKLVSQFSKSDPDLTSLPEELVIPVKILPTKKKNSSNSNAQKLGGNLVSLEGTAQTVAATHQSDQNCSDVSDPDNNPSADPSVPHKTVSGAYSMMFPAGPAKTTHLKRPGAAGTSSSFPYDHEQSSKIQPSLATQSATYPPARRDDDNNNSSNDNMRSANAGLFGEAPGAAGYYADMDNNNEAFQGWQSAYQEAEENAIEAQAKAQANCCLLLFQISVLALVVGKLDGADYNALWILSPIFLVSGCTLCGYAAFVYAGDSLGLFESGSGEPDEGAEGLMKADFENNNANNVIINPVDLEADGLMRETPDLDEDVGPPMGGQERDGLIRDSAVHDTREPDGLMKADGRNHYSYDDDLD